jgi:CRISPR-associated exonuclease Cas4
MLGVEVPAGAVFHAASKRRREVVFSRELRALTEKAVGDVRALLAAGVVPPAVCKPRCEGCSLKAVCLPELAAEPARSRRYLAGLFELKGEER